MLLSFLRHNGSHEQSPEAHRANVVRLANIISMVVIGCCLIALYSFNQEYLHQKGYYSPFIFYTCVFLYYVSLASHVFFSFKKPYPKWLLLSNAYTHLVILLACCYCITYTEYWSLLALTVFCAAVLSVLALDNKESNVFGVTLTIVLLISYLLVVAREFGHGQSMWQFFNSQMRWVEVILIAFGQGILMILIGHLASQARDYKINALLNFSQAKNMQALNVAIVDNISSGIIVVNAEGIIKIINKKARIIFSTEHQLRQPERLIILSSALVQRFSKWKEMGLHNARPLEIGEYHYSVQFNALLGKEHLFLIQLENIIDNMNRVRETRLNSLGKLTASIAHEIKNPLSSIQGAAQLLNERITEECIEDESLKFLSEKIYRNSERIGSIIGNILDLFSNTPLQNELINVNHFIRYVVEEARMNDELAHVLIRSDLKESEAYSIYFDPSHFRQVLDNLMLNAVKHSDRPDTTIDIISSCSAGGRTLHIDILDNGKGVKLSDENRIFEPFFSSKGSLGLGLYLVREICFANQAQIHYVRRPTGGACFRITMECYLDKHHDS